MRRSAIGRALLAVFVLSGVSGLIYQSVWSHYLGLTLGHAAYAQSLVLAIYMGGMALGAWLASRYGVRWRRLILAYAVVEGLIGLIGLAFHVGFIGYTAFSQDTVLPRIGSDWLAQAWQWGSAALLITPQSVLLGMTFPLMSGGYLRIAPQHDGEILGGLYFANSIGAAAGALLCTFVLLPAIGMPGAVQVAAALNLLVAALAAALAAAIDRPGEAADAASAESPPAEAPLARHGTEGERMQRWLLAAAFVTGATSFVYEIGWVRLLNQALGTTVHSFELMLAAFILGLALGGLWVRHRSARIVDPVAATGHAQVWMGIAALLSVPMFARSFGWVGWMMEALARNAQGYVLFNVGSAAIAMLVMFPAAFFAGMTLPLMTTALLRRGRGEASIGRVYAANTLGAIVGVFVAMHVLIPTIGINLAVTLAAVGDLALGLLLLRVLVQVPRWRSYSLSLGAGVVALALGLHFGRIDPMAQAAGVFRTGKTSIEGGRVFYQRDGKTATVTVFTETEGYAVIATNGKPDAGLQVLAGRKASPDEVTMRMAAALPLGLHPHPKDVAIIGWGSGMTTATFASSPVPRSVATIEIERAMYDGARLFGPKVQAGYTDPRSHPHFDDARTWFATGNRQFDVIVSEPSNPWVTGVASLFTREWYALVRRHLHPDGVMVQWIQTYELDDRLLSTMVAALVREFPYVDVYLTNSSDLIFVASGRPIQPLDMAAFGVEPLHSELAGVGLSLPGDFAVRRIGSQRVLRAFVNYTGAPEHSDFHPVVSLDGPRARFMRESSYVLQGLVTNGMPVLDILEGRAPPPADAVTDEPQSAFAQGHAVGREVAGALRTGDTRALQALAPDAAAPARDLLSMHGAIGADAMPRWYADVATLAGKSIGALPADALAGAWTNPAWIAGDAALPPAARATLDAFDAAARRDVAHLREKAVAALEALRLEPSAPDVLREQMLVLAMLGAIGERRPGDVGALEHRWGGSIPPSGTYEPIRVFLQAWVDLPAAPPR